MNGIQTTSQPAKRVGHTVLLNLNQPLAPITHPNAQIFSSPWNAAQRLKHYDLIVLRYSEFDNRGTVDSYKSIFEKQMLEALDAGRTICFLHHDEAVPGDWFSSGNGYMDERQLERCYNSQAGFRWVFEAKVRVAINAQLVLVPQVKRGEFNSFLTKWGATRNLFKASADGKIDDVICAAGEYATGFALQRSRGTIIYLPFQMNFSNTDDLRESLFSLIDSLLTYMAKKVRELPEWARQPLFEKEKVLEIKRKVLLTELEGIATQLSPYEEAKSLLVASEYNLQSALPAFISARLGVPTEIDEIFAEDFWLLNAQKEKIAICEIKSIVKGFKKTAIYDAYNHRDKRGMPESFPALLFVSFNLQAGSWETKEAPITNDECRIAVENRVLVIRVEDLVCIWNAIAENKITIADVLAKTQTECGWLECRDGKLKIHG